ncbi:hypothetical protein [Burkholderia stagnalis]|uniref:hypothetical protein n=1 Tax=Burkholderia stagnalis TaxID=1503054 RepID=UPI000AFF0643|nr:hypothetical protein [Burkholderia stagnalis]
MNVHALKNRIAVLLVSLIAVANLSIAAPKSTDSGNTSEQSQTAPHQAWEASENGTTYKVVRLSGNQFLILYGSKENTDGYITYDRRDGSKGTEYIPWTSASSDITVNIQETSSGDIGVMLNSGGETVSFVARPYRPHNRIHAGIRSGSWSTVIAGRSVQFRIEKNRTDTSLDLGECRLKGKITTAGSAGETHLTLSPSVEACSTETSKDVDAKLLFIDDLVIVYADRQASTNLIFSGSASVTSTLDMRSQSRSMNCAQWRAMCRAKCSATTLPTGDFGFRFWNCVNACNALAGC